MVWRSGTASQKWEEEEEESYILDSRSSTLAEFFALFEGMKIALRKCQEDASIPTIVLYSDCQAMLELIRDFHARQA